MDRGSNRPAVKAVQRLRAVLTLSIALIAFLAASELRAHFQLNVNIRVAHVEHLANGVRVYLRLPTPYVLAQHVGAERADGSREAAPYTFNQFEGDQLMHYVDFDALARDPEGLGRLAADGHTLVSEGETLSAAIEQVRVYTALDQPPFATLAEAKAAFDAPGPARPTRGVFVGDTVTDVVLRYDTGRALYDYTFASTLDPGLENQEDTANLVLDHFPGGTQIFRATGLLGEPVAVSRFALAAAWTFVVEGVRHILEGYDHVLFVVCLAIGAVGFVNLLWRVTGFTLGHSVTLAVGFFGWVPQGGWFVPAVETGIALSIIYAAIIALRRRADRSSIGLTALIGLLHGLGFSFVLQEILQIDSPNLWHSLLAFNVGVEIGQLAIVLVVFPILLLVQRYWAKLAVYVRWAIAVPCIAIASLWTGERLVMLVDALRL